MASTKMDDLRRNCGELATISAVLYDVSLIPTIRLRVKILSLQNDELEKMIRCTSVGLPVGMSGPSFPENESLERVLGLEYAYGGEAHSNVSMVRQD